MRESPPAGHCRAAFERPSARSSKAGAFRGKRLDIEPTESQRPSRGSILATKMRRPVFAIIFSLVSFSAVAGSDAIVAIEYGGDLQRLCDRDRQSGEYAMCFSFIAAVLEIVTNNSIYALKVCIPPPSAVPIN